jgi:glycosyltransferase involved in cell wall biosynthesis
MKNITFIVPAYNCEGTIRSTLESIFRSNYSNGDEVVVVNDCSSDDTEAILHEHAKYRTGMRIISHSRNKGGSAARNTAVEHAQNELIFCLDSDNLLKEESIPLLKRYLLREEADAAAFQQLLYFNHDPKAVTHKWIFNKGVVTFADCLASVVVPISSGNYLFTKQSWMAAGGYPESSRALDAWGFGLRQLAEGHKMVVLENTAYFHRYGHESYWVRESKKGNISMTALQILLPYFELMEAKSVDYIMARKSRQYWFDNLNRRPLRTRSGTIGRGGSIINASETTAPRKNWWDLCVQRMRTLTRVDLLSA